MGIHETAIIDRTAVIHPSVTIGPYSVIGPNVSIAAGTRIGTHCCIGGPPEHQEHWDNWHHGVRIGADCWISNHITIDSGTEFDTIIMDRVTILRHAHVGHDAVVEHNVTLSCDVIVGGHSLVMEYANCGLGAIIHQRMVIGPMAMLGMGCVVTKKTSIGTGKIYAGNPARFLKENTIGIERSGLDQTSLKALEFGYQQALKDMAAKK